MDAPCNRLFFPREHKRGLKVFASPHRELLDEPLDLLSVVVRERLEVGPVERRVGVAVGTEVLVDLLRLDLEDAHAAAVEPGGATLATDVKPKEKKALQGVPSSFFV